MLIVIKESEKKKICFRIPTRLMINSFTACIVPRFIKGHDVKITPKQLINFFRTIHKCRRRCKNWDIVEVASSNGEYVRIRL